MTTLSIRLSLNCDGGRENAADSAGSLNNGDDIGFAMRFQRCDATCIRHIHRRAMGLSALGEVQENAAEWPRASAAAIGKTSK
jgi:hypothetical protein